MSKIGSDEKSQVQCRINHDQGQWLTVLKTTQKQTLNCDEFEVMSDILTPFCILKLRYVDSKPSLRA